jgi:hypothetical protein
VIVKIAENIVKFHTGDCRKKGIAAPAFASGSLFNYNCEPAAELIKSGI